MKKTIGPISVLAFASLVTIQQEAYGWKNKVMMINEQPPRAMMAFIKKMAKAKSTEEPIDTVNEEHEKIEKEDRR